MKKWEKELFDKIPVPLIFHIFIFENVGTASIHYNNKSKLHVTQDQKHGYYRYNHKMASKTRHAQITDVNEKKRG